MTPPGGKIWRWAYRFEGKHKLIPLGKYPDVSLSQARSRHAENRKLLAGGVDPMAHRRAAKTAATLAQETSFKVVAGKWLAYWQEGKSKRHVDSTRRRLEANVFPLLADRSLGDIEAPEIVAMVRAIDERGARDIAKRALETSGQIFRFGIAHGYTKRNPVAEIKTA